VLVQTVLAEWKTWRGAFSDFCAHLRDHCRVLYGATLVSSILSSHGLRTPARREGRSPDERALRGAFEVFFPNAQWVGDGSQISIDVCDATYVFNLELLVDPYSDAFVGASLGDQEDSDAVALAIADAKATTGVEPPLPLSVLLDNKSSNHTPEVDQALDGAERLRATPGRPQNKAHIERGFGLLAQTAPPLVVEGADPRRLARSILQLVLTTFFRAVNHRPRKDRGGRSRVEIQGETPTAEQIEEARKALHERCRRQELARQTLEARQNPETRRYLD
jgi:transposase InsO family protein